MTKQSEIFGGGSASGIGLPTFTSDLPAPLYTQTSSHQHHRGNRMAGFVGDGDYFLTPDQSNGLLEYYNASGSMQWQYLKASFNATTIEWSGFYFKGALLHVVTWASGNTVVLSTVDAAGTIVELGNSVVGAFAGGSPRWHLAVDANSSSYVQYDWINDEVYIGELGNPNGSRIAKISAVNAALVRGPTAIDVTNTININPLLITEKGAIWCTVVPLVWQFAGSKAATECAVDITRVVFSTGDVALAGLPGIVQSSADFKFVGYQNDSTGHDGFCLVKPNATTELALSRYIPRVAFLNWIDAMVNKLGYGLGA